MKPANHACVVVTLPRIIFFTETPPRTQRIIKPDNHRLYGSTDYLQPQATINGRKHFGRWRHLYPKGSPPSNKQKSFIRTRVQPTTEQINCNRKSPTNQAVRVYIRHAENRLGHSCRNRNGRREHESTNFFFQKNEHASTT